MSQHSSVARAGHFETCPDCGKRGYRDRATAKTARKLTGPHLAVYQCTSDLWHVGHRDGGRPRTAYAVAAIRRRDRG